MKKLIAIADWASDSLTNQEFSSAVEGFLKRPDELRIHFIVSTPSTIHTSYLATQVIETEERFGRAQQTVLFLNTDPRLQTSKKAEGAQGAQLIIARLFSGILVCGPNTGYNFSLFRNKVQVLYVYREIAHGSQFRSRDFYSRICAHLMDEIEQEMDLEEIPNDTVPLLKDPHIGHIDNYGNIKTTMTKEDFKGKYEFGETVSVRIHGVSGKLLFVENLFAAEVGTPIIYPGSSGPKDNPYLEISAWSHFIEEKPVTGAFLFNYPHPGTKIEIVK